MMGAHDPDYTGMAAALTALAGVITAIGVLAGALIKVWSEVRKTREDYDKIWTGMVRRGFMEAARMGHLLAFDTGTQRWTLSPEARVVYEPVAQRLKTIYSTLKGKLGKEPADEVLGLSIEMELQDWMVTHACPALNLNQYGCLAIAAVIGKEP